MQIPILKSGDILITSIQIALTDREALQFQDDVLAEVARADAKGLVIDITAMDVVDSFMARVLNETANMAQLMGTRTVIAGMRPAVALTLVEMGRRLVGVETALNLEQGLTRLLRLTGEGPAMSHALSTAAGGAEGAGDETATT